MIGLDKLPRAFNKFYSNSSTSPRSFFPPSNKIKTSSTPFHVAVQSVNDIGGFGK